MEQLFTEDEYTDMVDCYGRFDFSATICRKFCAVRLRCAVEQSEQLKIEQLEDMIGAYEISQKIQ
ncbi:MAG: hypothetical protein R6T92_11535 [Desulfosalsimonadaceae bacterium]